MMVLDHFSKGIDEVLEHYEAFSLELFNTLNLQPSKASVKYAVNCIKVLEYLEMKIQLFELEKEHEKMMSKRNRVMQPK